MFPSPRCLFLLPHQFHRTAGRIYHESWIELVVFVVCSIASSPFWLFSVELLNKLNDTHWLGANSNCIIWNNALASHTHYILCLPETASMHLCHEFIVCQIAVTVQTLFVRHNTHFVEFVVFVDTFCILNEYFHPILIFRRILIGFTELQLRKQYKIKEKPNNNIRKQSGSTLLCRLSTHPN